MLNQIIKSERFWSSKESFPHRAGEKHGAKRRGSQVHPGYCIVLIPHRWEVRWGRRGRSLCETQEYSRTIALSARLPGLLAKTQAASGDQNANRALTMLSSQNTEASTVTEQHEGQTHSTGYPWCNISKVYLNTTKYMLVFMRTIRYVHNLFSVNFTISTCKQIFHILCTLNSHMSLECFV